MNPTRVLLLGVKKVSTNCWFHVAPQREGWRLPASWPPSVQNASSVGHQVLQPSSSPKLCRGTPDRPHTTAAETRTLGFIHSSSVPQEGFYIHQNIFICHRFQVPLGVVFVSVPHSLMTSAFHKHKHTCFSIRDSDGS